MTAATVEKKKLGRGLGALLSDSEPSVAVSAPSGEQTLPVTLLEPSNLQPRHYFDEELIKALSESIRAQGVLQPLLVRQKADGSGRYEIIAGERRWRASQLAGLTEVPVVIRNLEDGKALEVAIVENVQRSDLNPVDEAAGYLRLVNEFNYTHEDMARVTGKSRSHITNLLRLLSLPESIKGLLAKGDISMGHARALLPLNESERQAECVSEVVKKNLSVRETEDMVRKVAEEEQGTRTRRTRATKDMATKELEARLSKKLGVEVSITQKDGAGVLRLPFSSQLALADILQKMGL